MTGCALNDIMGRELEPQIAFSAALDIVSAAFFAGKLRLSWLKNLWKSS